MKYVAQCTAGMQTLVADQLGSGLLSDFRVINSEEGFVFFETSAKLGDVLSISYFSNIFGVVTHLDGAGLDIGDLVRHLLRNSVLMSGAERLVTPNERTFRVAVSDEGRLVAGGNHLGSFMDALAEVTGLSHNSRKADAEFWVMRRRSGLCFLCKRLKQRSKTERDLQKGELRPELTELICLLSEPNKDDIFVDPCAGSGTIPFARTKYPYNMIFALDNDEAKVKLMRHELKSGKTAKLRKGRPVIVAVADAIELSRFEDNFITKVVTDPPWGYYDEGIPDVFKFFQKLLSELSRITRVGGTIVMLIGDKLIADKLIIEYAEKLDLSRRFEILVNGKKASLVKWHRINGQQVR